MTHFFDQTRRDLSFDWNKTCLKNFLIHAVFKNIQLAFQEIVWLTDIKIIVMLSPLLCSVFDLSDYVCYHTGTCFIIFNI